jgi:8-oxo-dGTP diphosphatase
MPGVERSLATRIADALWRNVLWFGFRVARVWWHIRRPDHQGALVAIYVGDALLVLKSSYRNEWGLPGGSIHAGETPEVAARREMEEEIGFPSQRLPLVPAGSVTGVWDGRHDTVHFFELHLERLPELRLDYREIIGTRLVSPEELRGIALTAAVAAYVAQRTA